MDEKGESRERVDENKRGGTVVKKKNSRNPATQAKKGSNHRCSKEEEKSEERKIKESQCLSGHLIFKCGIKAERK